jgi:hypothetical protein
MGRSTHSGSNKGRVRHVRRGLERFSNLQILTSFVEGGFFLKKKPLGGVVPVYINWRTALVAEAGADGHAFAANGAAAAEHGGAGLGLHARTETVCLHALTAIWLKGTLGHENALLFPR